MFRIISVIVALVGLVLFAWGCQQERPETVNNLLPETNGADYAIVLRSPNATYDQQNAFTSVTVSIIKNARENINIDSVAIFYLDTTSIPRLLQHVWLGGVRFSFNYDSTLWSCDNIEWDIRNLPRGTYWLYADVYGNGKILDQEPTLFPFELNCQYLDDLYTVTLRQL